MCNDSFKAALAPLGEHHLAAVTEQFPHQKHFAQEIYTALRENLTPQANLLVAFVTLKELYDLGRTGIFAAFGRVLYAPLSIVAKTGLHEWTRFRPKAVEELHDSFLSFMMAKSNRLAVEEIFLRHGLMISQRHCCGIIMGDVEAVTQFEASQLAADRNRMRSYAEAMGMPVVITDFTNIPTMNSDCGPTEEEFYHLYTKVFALVPEYGQDYYLDHAQDVLWSEILDALPPLVEGSQLAA